MTPSQNNDSPQALMTRPQQPRSKRNIVPGKGRKPIEMFDLNDGTIVIVGVHLTAEEAEEQWGDRFRAWFDRPGEKIDWVSHGWMRYEVIGNDDMDFDDDMVGKGAWILYEQKNRPKGVTRAATVIA